MSIQRLLLAATTLVAVGATAGAQRADTATVFDSTVASIHYTIRAMHGRVELVMQPRNLARDIAHLDAPYQARPPLGQTVIRLQRGFLDPDSVARFLIQADRDAAILDTVRVVAFGEQKRRTASVRAPLFEFGGEAVRSAASDHLKYYVRALGCRGRAIGDYLEVRGQWGVLLDAFRRVVPIAKAQRANRPGRSSEQTLAVYNADELSCPVDLLQGNSPPLIAPRGTYLRGARAAAIDFTVDTLGFVTDGSARVAVGDSDLLVPTRLAARQWRFMPALVADQHPVAQRLRVFVTDRAPVLARDTAAVDALAREAGAGFAVSAAEQAPPIEEKMNVVGAKLRVLRFGDFARIVFIPGPGERADFWKPVGAALMPSVESIAYDLRGHGGSTVDPNGNYSVRQHADDLDSLMHWARYAGQILVADRGSSAIAAEIARRHPKSIRALVLIDPLGRATGPERLAQFNAIVLGLQELRRTDGSALDLTIRNARFPVDTRLGMMIRDTARVTPADAVMISNASALEYDLAGSIAAYAGPTYILFSKETAPHEPGFFYQLYAPGDRQRAPNVTVQSVLPQRWSMLTDPTAFTNALRQILGDLRP